MLGWAKDHAVSGQAECRRATSKSFNSRCATSFSTSASPSESPNAGVAHTKKIALEITFFSSMLTKYGFKWLPIDFYDCHA
jgi:hypothetical protein